MLFITVTTLFYVWLAHISSAILRGSALHVQTIIPFCPTGEFPCNGSDTCVEQRKNCDGIEDCEDGSDEWRCEDKNKKEFWNILFKKRPDEDRDKEVGECELDNLPGKCRCSSTKLFCDHLKLKHPPKNISFSVMELDLSGNQLGMLESKHFPKRERLHTLILTSSEITSISKNTFENLPYLQRLYLTGNNFSVIVNGTLSKNTNLNSLTLSHNPLVEIQGAAFEGLDNLAELDLRECKLKTLPAGVFDSLVNLRILFLDGNELKTLTAGIFHRLNNLEILSLSRNQIEVAHFISWTGISKLRTLFLSQNSITRLDADSFGNMSSLRKLDLHGNKIRTIYKDALLHLSNLESLDLRMNELRKPLDSVFDSLISLEYIYFDDFHFCSRALHVRVCEPRGDGISSIAHLLDSVVLRVSVWLVAVVASLGNIAVLIGRFFLNEPNEVHSFYIKNLSLADLLMSVYLFTIAGYDLVFRGEYIRHETQWRHSWQCNFCGFLSTLSSESSVLVLTIITTDRYLSIIHPLSVKKRTISSAAVTMGLSWAAAIILSALPILDLGYYGDEFYGNNGVCLPLHIHDPFGQAWEYSTFLFCGVNLIAFLFIFFAYISMFFTISNSKIGLRCTQQQQDRNIAKRFAFIVATDFLCWVPIVFIKVIAMSGVPIQEDLYAWVAVFLLPVNSAINPILYTLTTKLFKQHLAKMVYNFRVSSALSGDSFPSLGRNQSLRENQRDSLSRGDHNNISLVSSVRSCADCRRLNRMESFDVTCQHGRRHSGRKTEHTNVV